MPNLNWEAQCYQDGLAGHKPSALTPDSPAKRAKERGYERYLANKNLADRLSQSNQSVDVGDTSETSMVDVEAIAASMSSYRYNFNQKMALWKLDPEHGKCAFCGLVADKNTQFTILENQRPAKTRHLDPFPHCGICGRYFCPMHGVIVFNYAPDGYWVRCKDHPYHDGFWKSDPFDIDGEHGDLGATWDVPSWDAQSAAARHKSNNETVSQCPTQPATERVSLERAMNHGSSHDSPLSKDVVVRQERMNGERRLSNDELARRADDVIAAWKRRQK